MLQERSTLHRQCQQQSLRRMNTRHGLKRGQAILDGLDQSEMRNQPEIKHKLMMGLTIQCLCAVVVFALNGVDSAQYKIMSLCVGICLHAFVVYWLYLIGTSSQLHRIRFITTRLIPFVKIWHFRLKSNIIHRGRSSRHQRYWLFVVAPFIFSLISW